MTETSVSLIMCTLGRLDCLPRLLQSLALQDNSQFELIVVDQNPVGYLDAFVALARQQVRVVYLRSAPGLSRARNLGITHARGQLLAFPDDDCWYPAGVLARMVVHFAANPCLEIITCRTVDKHGRDSNGSFLQQDAVISRRNVWKVGNSNGLFVRTSLARRLHGFNADLGVGAGTQFGSGEESDFLLRALAAGAKGRYLAGLHTHHDQVDTVMNAQALRRARLYSRGYGRTLRLNHYPAWFAVYRALHSTAAAVLSLLTLRPRAMQFKGIWAAGILAGYLAAVNPMSP